MYYFRYAIANDATMTKRRYYD